MQPLVGLALVAWLILLSLAAITVYLLAQGDYFFTAPKEATARFVMRGNAVHKMITVWEGKRGGADVITKLTDKYQIVDDPDGSSLLHYLNPLNWMEAFGIYWIGIWPFYQIYRYDFVWSEEQKDDQGKLVLRTRYATKREGTEGQTKFVFLNDVNYGFVVNDAKTKGGIPLRFTLIITARVENPYMALFLGEDWLLRVGGAVSDMVIRYAGALEYEQVVGSEPAALSFTKSDGTKDSKFFTLEDLIKALGDGAPDDFTGTDLLTAYGVRIVALKRSSFVFADEAAEKAYKDATTKRYVGEQEGLAEEAKAQGEAKAVAIRAAAEKGRIDTVYGAIAGTDESKRMEIRRLEAMEKSGSEGGNTIVVPDEVLGLARHFTKP